jgi:hypothetical protein
MDLLFNQYVKDRGDTDSIRQERQDPALDPTDTKMNMHKICIHNGQS